MIFKAKLITVLKHPTLSMHLPLPQHPAPHSSSLSLSTNALSTLHTFYLFLISEPASDRLSR